MSNNKELLSGTNKTTEKEKRCKIENSKIPNKANTDHHKSGKKYERGKKNIF